MYFSSFYIVLQEKIYHNIILTLCVFMHNRQEENQKKKTSQRIVGHYLVLWCGRHCTVFDRISACKKELHVEAYYRQLPTESK